MTKTFSFILIGFAALTLSGCAQDIRMELEQDAQYWQRKDTTDSIYQRGPKAQQMLFQDMARCTSDLKEMERLGALKDTIPSDAYARKENTTPASRLAEWDSPERKGYLRAEEYDYTDFETCMASKGWERVKYVNYEMKQRAYNDYLDTIGIQQYRKDMRAQVSKKTYNQ